MSSAALAAYRRARAVELALAGNSSDEIAHELGLANRGTAWRLVHNALRDRKFAAVDAYRQAELERLQRVEDQLWPRAIAGDTRVVGGMRVIINQRIRLQPRLPPDAAIVDWAHAARGIVHPLVGIRFGDGRGNPVPGLPPMECCEPAVGH